MEKQRSGFVLVEFLFDLSLAAVAVGAVALASHLVPEKGLRTLGKPQPIPASDQRGDQRQSTPNEDLEGQDQLSPKDSLAQQPSKKSDEQRGSSAESMVVSPQDRGSKGRLKRDSRADVSTSPHPRQDKKGRPTPAQGRQSGLDFSYPGDPASCQAIPSLPGCEIYTYDDYPYALYSDPYSPENQQQYYSWYGQQDPSQMFFTDPGQLYMQDPIQYGLLEDIYSFNPIPGLPGIPGF